MKPYIGNIIVLPLPSPVLVTHDAEQLIAAVDAAVGALGAHIVPADRDALAQHARTSNPPPLSELRGGPEYPGLMRALVTDVGPGVPELEAGDVVLFQVANGPFSVGHRLDGGRLLLNAGHVVAWERESEDDR